MKPILISGIQPTGRLHLGNYLGALKNFVELQNSGKYQCLFFIADYHSLTIDFNPKKKSEEVLDVARAYLTAGLDPKKSSLFVQSHIPESTELAWIFNTIAPIGELERMTQLKEKTGDARVESRRRFIDLLVKTLSESLIENYQQNLKRLPTEQDTREFVKVFANKVDLNSLEESIFRQKINAGLLTYPLLMAADILLYDAKIVPVGEDQLQHLELARTLARKFNNRFGQTFVEPQALLTKTPRVMSLNNPEKKMSKSLPEGCLFLDDSPKDIEEKIKHAVTDSGSEVKFDEKNKPGISNLLLIYEALSGTNIAELEKKYAGKGYGKFKADLANVAAEALKPFRENKASDATLKKHLKAGAAKAKKLAMAKMRDVKKKLGLL